MELCESCGAGFCSHSYHWTVEKPKKNNNGVIITKGVLMSKITINLSFANHD